MSQEPHYRPKTILVVDDELGVLDLLQALLSNAGYQVETAPNGIEGLNLFRSRDWDAVISDRTMPYMNGEEMAAQMRALRPNVPILLLTGAPSRVENHHLFDHIMAKPFRLTDLLDQVAQLARPAACSQSA